MGFYEVRKSVDGSRLGMLMAVETLGINGGIEKKSKEGEKRGRQKVLYILTITFREFLSLSISVTQSLTHSLY